jgi:hypothetical protein
MLGPSFINTARKGSIKHRRTRRTFTVSHPMSLVDALLGRHRWHTSAAQSGGETMMAFIAGQSSLGQIRACFSTLARPSRLVIRGVAQNMQIP